jgi:hypothetical protein
MKYRIPQYFLLFALFVFLSCNDSDKNTDDSKKRSQTKKPDPTGIIVASMDAVAPDSVRKEFKNLISIADCESPLGKIYNAGKFYIRWLHVFQTDI